MLLLLLAGCASRPEITAGDYAFETLAVEDGCLDGALEALFMPEGPETPHAFEYPIFVPAWEDTPQSYDVSFRAPFVGMPVTVEATDAGLAVRGSVMDAVLLNEGAYGDCVATMTVDADLWPDGDGRLAGQARIDVSNPRGDEGRCPSFDADPCRVTLAIAAAL